MILILLGLSLAIAFATSAALTFAINTPLHGVLNRLVGKNTVKHWHKFGLFAIYTSGVARGMNSWRLYHNRHASGGSKSIASYDMEQWILELYRVAEYTFSGVMIASFTFFAIMLIVFAIVRGLESKRTTPLSSG